jgi:transcriptional regulator with XRE-family HTH domain
MKQNFAENLKRLRATAEMTQTELSGKSGISRPTIGAYEEGRSQPNVENLAKIAGALGIDPSEVLFEFYPAIFGKPSYSFATNIDLRDEIRRLRVELFRTKSAVKEFAAKI